MEMTHTLTVSPTVVRSTTQLAAGHHLAERAVARPTIAIDEAFAEMPEADADRRVAHAGRRANQLAVVKELADQLRALDRQREQLARLLRDIDVTAQAE